MTNRENLNKLDNKQLARAIIHLSQFSEEEIYKWLEYDDLYLTEILEWVNNRVDITDNIMRWRRGFDRRWLESEVTE